MSERARRLSENEALFRQVNDQIEGVNRTFAVMTQTMDIVCECGDGDCVERILMTLPKYERVRRDPTRFVVRPGHQISDVEDVVERQQDYVVVRKREGEPADVARELDTRSS